MRGHREVFLLITGVRLLMLSHFGPNKLLFQLTSWSCIKKSMLLTTENNSLFMVCLLDLTADFRVKTNAGLSAAREREQIGIQICIYTVTLTPILRRIS